VARPKADPVEALLDGNGKLDAIQRQVFDLTLKLNKKAEGLPAIPSAPRVARTRVRKVEAVVTE